MPNFYSSLNGIPIDYLVATPLLAAARANLTLAQNMEEFIYQVGYVDGDPKGKTNILSFDLTRYYSDPNTGKPAHYNFTVNVPLLGIVPIPALLVDSVTVNFTTTVNSSTSSNSSVTANVGGSYSSWGFQVSASVSANASHMRSSNQSATYSFLIQADQQPATEGMSKMMDVFASVITPIEPPSSS